jgi:hypothetical protein
MTKAHAPLLSGPIPARDVVAELRSDNRPQNGHPVVAQPVEESALPPHPAPIPPVDFHHVHRKLERLLVSLEQTGAIPSDEVHHIRATP